MTAVPSLFRSGSLWLGVHDAMSARIARDADVAGLWLSSYGVSASLKASPDASLVTSFEMLMVARPVCHAAAEVPVVVDCDTGYGDAAVFAAVVRDYADTTNVAALCIEDKVYPKRNTLYANDLQDLEPVETLEAKVRAAVHVRGARRPALQIIARTEALALGAGVDETVTRLRRYVAAGADAVLVQSKGPLADLQAVAARWRLERSAPLICVPTSYPEVPATTWWGYGFDVVVRSHQLLQGAIAAQLALLGDLGSGDVAPAAYVKRLAAHERIDRLVGLDQLPLMTAGEDPVT
jgi:phosphoenolpyruvate phosphomutase